MEKNIRDFNLFTAIVLERLYDNFPNPIIISTDEIDDNADRETVRTYTNTMIFLKEEGFIRYSMIATDNVFMDAVLTAKGLSILNLIPEGITEKKSIIQQIKHVIKDGSKLAIKTTIEVFIQEAIKWLKR